MIQLWVFLNHRKICYALRPESGFFLAKYPFVLNCRICSELCSVTSSASGSLVTVYIVRTIFFLSVEYLSSWSKRPGDKLLENLGLQLKRRETTGRFLCAISATNQGQDFYFISALQTSSILSGSTKAVDLYHRNVSYITHCAAQRRNMLLFFSTNHWLASFDVLVVLTTE